MKSALLQNDGLKSPTRREKFRAFMGAFNPTAAASALLREDLVCENLHDSLYQKLAARADLEPGSQQLIVGGIGSGKTTELRLAQRWLNQNDFEHQIYLDVTAETDLTNLKSGALLASFGLHLIVEISNYLFVKFESIDAGLSESQRDDFKQASKAVNEFALGKTITRWVSRSDEDYEPDDSDDSDDGYYETNKVPGKLFPPRPQLQSEIQFIRAPLKKLLDLLANVTGTSGHVVLICDGLDRLITAERFWAVVHQDCRVLKSLKISLLATAPLSILYGGREVAEYFDRVHHLPAIAFDGEGAQLLELVLAKRGSNELLDRNQAISLCMASGGVLRDLITLARDAAEEAYIAGLSKIEDEQIASSIEQLGTSYLRGLGARQRSRLRSVSNDGPLDFSNPINMELLATRRILEYSASVFRVHPALLPLLARVED